MHPNHALLLRAARRLHTQYEKRRASHEPRYGAVLDETIDYYLRRARDYERLLHTSLERGWKTAETDVRADFGCLLRELERTIASKRERMDRPETAVPTLGDLYRELEAACDEFGEIELDDAENRISVQTDSITLEGIHLGPFRLDVCLDEIATKEVEGWDRVVAIDPCPPTNNEDITHPHVSGDHLCAGDALYPINAALTEGRLSDFFLLVRSVLQTYNPDSAHVRLEEWDGRACDECGYVTNDDNLYSCDRCECSVCDECSRCCNFCSCSLCRSCSLTSTVSDEYMCKRCATTCTQCECKCAADETEDGLCPSCLEERDESEVDSQTDDTPKESTDVCSQASTQ